jgi:hypothetical protein
MKKIVSVIIVCLIGIFCYCQTGSQTIQITTDKTTSIIFPFPIIHVDRGSAAILVQQITEAQNILLVKAAAKDFSATNMTVATADGSVYSFAMQFVLNPEKWIYEVRAQLHGSIETYARSIVANSRTMHGISDRCWDVTSKIIGIYIKGDVLYYQLMIDNRSPIDYDIDFLRFYIRDKRKGRRTATQENELKPLYECGNTNEVSANSKSVVVVALQKFTIPDAKYQAVEINERNGGRHLKMRIGNRKIVKAVVLPDIK